MTVPIWNNDQNVVQGIGTRSKPYLFGDPRQRTTLEADAGVPFRADRRVHTALELCARCVRIGQVFDEVFRSFLVALFRDDDVGLTVVCTRAWIDSRDLFDEEWFWWRFGSSPAAP